MQKETILIVGSVNWKLTEANIIEKWMDNTFTKEYILIYGKCPGVAKIVENYASKKGWKTKGYSPKFSYNKIKALDDRNKELVNSGKPNKIYAISNTKYPNYGELNILKYAETKYSNISTYKIIL